MSPRRCSFVGENGLRCKLDAYLDGELCWVHSERARKDKQRLPSYGGGLLSKYEARTRALADLTTDNLTIRDTTGLSVEPVTRTEPSDGYIDSDDDDHVDPLDRIEDMAAEYKRTRRG